MVYSFSFRATHGVPASSQARGVETRTINHKRKPIN